MIRNGRDIPAGASLDCDICVVGSGPAGIALAERLLASGLRVCLLESGFERPSASSRRLSRGRRSGAPYFRLERARTRAVGGSSWEWGTAWPHAGGMRSRRLDAEDFAARAHVPGSGWPFGLEALEPWYALAEARSGISSARAADTPLGHGLESTVCAFGRADAFRSSGAFRGRDAGTLVTGATVVALNPSASGDSVESVRVATPGGGWFLVRAPRFVLAGGGIENARLLLASPLGRPGAVANPFGQVGRNFMEHLHVESGSLSLFPGSQFEPAEYARHAGPSGPVLRVWRLDAETQNRQGLLNTTVEVRSRHPLFFSPAVRSLAELAWAAGERQWPPALAAHLGAVAREPVEVVRALTRRFLTRQGLEDGALALVLTTEQAPNPRSRVVLGHRRDSFGVPLPHLHWEFSPLDLTSIRGTQDALDDALNALGIGRVTHRWGETGLDPYIHGCRHHIGTTRMSATPATGVVDADCRVHGLTNVYAAGSSVMPTAGAITVTFTAVALALRLAQHLATTPAGATR